MDIGELELGLEGVPFAPFTQQMQLRGSITTPQPFPADLDNVPIGPDTNYPITWSFNTGLGSFNNSNTSLAGTSTTVSTDENGNITELLLQALSPSPPYENNQAVSGFFLAYAIDQSPLPIEGIVFTNLMICIYDEDEPEDECEQFTEDSALAGFPPGGTWSRTSPLASAVPVPGLGGLAVFGLGAVMLGVASRRGQRAKQRPAAH